MFSSVTHVKASRKSHRCDFCQCRIDKGKPSVKIASHYYGEFSSGRAHPDCYEFWSALYPIYADPWDGMPYDLLDAIGEDEGREFLLSELEPWREQFPGPVGRLERRLRNLPQDPDA